MLDNISLFTHLHTLEEAFLSFVLVASFGPKIEDQYKIHDAILKPIRILPLVLMPSPS